MTDTGYTAVATQKHPLMVYAERFDARTEEIKNMLPPGISPERFKRACRTAAQLNPEILGCSWSSIWNSAAKACRDGLLPDGVHAAFVPYKGVCAYLPMVRGRLLQFQQSGAAKWVTAQCVYEGDEFAHYIDEHGEHLRHTPSDVFDDKKIVRAYAMATTKDSAVFIRVMPRAEIDKHRSFSRTKRDDAPWVVHYAEMAKKTVLHGLAKMLPNAPMLEDESYDDDEEETRPQLAAVNPNRERGAAAALDAFAGSPDERMALSIAVRCCWLTTRAEQAGAVTPVMSPHRPMNPLLPPTIPPMPRRRRTRPGSRTIVVLKPRRRAINEKPYRQSIGRPSVMQKRRRGSRAGMASENQADHSRQHRVL